MYYTKEHLVAYPVEYIAGIDLYNAGEYHAAHDAWEERWMGPVSVDEKLFLQAMIQSAVAFHHLQIGRPGAARRMYLMAKEKFKKLNAPVFMSLDLNEYQQQLDRALSWLLSVADPREIEQPEFDAPVICLQPLAIMAIMTGVSQWIITAKMVALRAAMNGTIDQVPFTDPRRIEFNSLHRYSTTVMMVAMVAGLIAFFITTSSSMRATKTNSSVS